MTPEMKRCGGKLSALGMALALVTWGCSGSSEMVGDDGTGNGTGGASNESGGAGNGTGGAQESGGSTSSGGYGTGGTTSGGGTDSGTGGAGGANSGGSSSGGSSSGGSSSGGQNGEDLDANQCTDEVPCNVGSTCYDPGTEAAVNCGAPDWCGECDCPEMPFLPTGAGTGCSSDEECPSASDTERTASSCENSQCAECAVHQDCPNDFPFCGIEEFSGAQICFQCQTNEDCPSEQPVCNVLHGNWGTNTAGSCVECVVDLDCASGVCSRSNTCVPQCANDADCGPNEACGDDERCVPQTCESPEDCSSASRCQDEGDDGIAPLCVPKSCADGSSCGEGNYCVSGACYDRPGTCQYDAVP